MSELSELFERDPCGFNDQDISIIVAKMREHNAQFELGAVKPPKATKTPKESKGAQILKDLGL